MGTTCVVVAGGEAIPAHVRVDDGALVIAADSGVDRAYERGWRIDIAVGDFDSISAVGLERAQAERVRIDRYPAEKDKTDLELALDVALDLGATDLVVVGAGGGRLDHLLANLLVLAAPQFASCRISVIARAGRAHVVQGGGVPTQLAAAVGDTVTLLPVGGATHGITTSGLQYPLTAEDLAPGTTRGVSNVVATTPASVWLDRGTLLVIIPEPGEH